MALFTWQKKQNDKGEDQLELPDEIVASLKEGKETKEKLGKVETLLEGLLKIQQDDKTAREKAVKDAADAKAREAANKNTEQLDTELEELILTNPREAIRRATEGQTAAIKAVHADNVRRELFEDEQKFKYYHGDIKREVDALLASQSVDFRLNPANIENCYLTVVGKHNDEIVEGKLKSRFASGSSGGGISSGNAGDTSTGGKEKPVIDSEYEKEIRKAAKQVGIKYEAYVEMLDKEGVL